jgi:hypothetical protein
MPIIDSSMPVGIRGRGPVTGNRRALAKEADSEMAITMGKNATPVRSGEKPRVSSR